MNDSRLPDRPVVDASVAIKWFIEESWTDAAERLLRSGRHLLVPDLIFPEVGNIVWKNVRREDLTENEAVDIMRSLGHLSLLVYPSQPLIASAVEIACRTNRTVYDSLYLALALQESTMMVTADERFFNALQATHYANQVFWVADIP